MKKLISLLLVVFMTALLPVSVFAETEPNTFDVNGDGKVNMFDYIFIKGIYFGTIDTVPEFDGADVNGDGEVNIFDCVLVKKAYLSSDNQVTPEEKDVPYTAHGLSGSLEEYDIQGIRPEYGMELVSFLVTDFDQLNALLDVYLNYGNSVNDEPFIDFAEALPENYFESKALVVTPVYASSGSTHINIENVRANGSEITTEISVTHYGDGTDDCQNRLMTAEVDKSDIASCTTARAEIVKANIYGIERSFNGSAPFAEDELLASRLITNAEQLDELVEACDPIYATEFIEYAESLPENFFDTKAITVTAVELPNPGYSVYTAAVIAGRDGVELYFDRWYDDRYCYPDVVVEMIFVNEIDKSDFGNVSDITASYLD